MSQKKYLVTTAIDYVNDVIHIGHAYEKVLSDCYARHLRGVHGGEHVYFLTGTDEHGQKIQQSAEKAGLDPQSFTDQIAAQDKAETEALGVSFNRFIRTTDTDHVQTSIDFWNKVYNNAKDDMYEAEYTGLYCVGDEAFVNASDLINGKCPNHPTLELKEVKEKNYFFRLSAYQDFLLEYFEKNPQFVQPELRRKEMTGFLERGLEDVAISRRKESVSWGIEVPQDKQQVIYVWFDALINYFTAAKENGFWDEDTTIIHFVGKDINRWHSLLWPAMLQAAGYRLPSVVVAHGFLSLNGQKISKSIGNVIRPSELVDKYGADAIRYYLLRYTRLEDDADLSFDLMQNMYNADLANGFGNLVSRVARLCGLSGFENDTFLPTYASVVAANPDFATHIEQFRFGEALAYVWEKVNQANKHIDYAKPWEMVKQEESKDQLKATLAGLVGNIHEIATLLLPFIPNAAEKTLDHFSKPQILAMEPLFPRL